MVASEDLNHWDVKQGQDQEDKEHCNQHLVVSTDTGPQLFHRISGAMNLIQDLVCLLRKMPKILILKCKLLNL